MYFTNCCTASGANPFLRAFLFAFRANQPSAVDNCTATARPVCWAFCATMRAFAGSFNTDTLPAFMYVLIRYGSAVFCSKYKTVFVCIISGHCVFQHTDESSGKYGDTPRTIVATDFGTVRFGRVYTETDFAGIAVPVAVQRFCDADCFVAWF